jgi:hypothetical protein
MTTSEMVVRNLDLAFEVIQQVVAEPALADEVAALAGDGTLVLYDENDAELSEANDRLVAIMEDRGDHPVPVALQRRLSLAPR